VFSAWIFSASQKFSNQVFPNPLTFLSKIAESNFVAKAAFCPVSGHFSVAFYIANYSLFAALAPFSVFNLF